VFKGFRKIALTKLLCAFVGLNCDLKEVIRVVYLTKAFNDGFMAGLGDSIVDGLLVMYKRDQILALSRLQLTVLCLEACRVYLRGTVRMKLSLTTGQELAGDEDILTLYRLLIGRPADSLAEALGSLAKLDGKSAEEIRQRVGAIDVAQFLRLTLAVRGAVVKWCGENIPTLLTAEVQEDEGAAVISESMKLEDGIEVGKLARYVNRLDLH